MVERELFSKEPDKNHIEDLSLSQAITDGSLEAWHTFLDRFAGLIHGVVRRCIFTEDEDITRGIYVDILKKLYEGEIGRFRGETSLATWLIIFARSRTYDFVRRRYGRYREPAGINKLSEFDRMVFRLFYMERLPMDIVVHIINWRGLETSAEDIVESMQRIEEVVDRRYLRRLDLDHQAKMYGVDSGRMLRYLVQLKQEYEEKAYGSRPDVHLMNKEVHGIVAKVREMVAQLTAEEQEVVHMWYEGKLSAPLIAERLGLESQRRVYTIKNRVMRKLRKSMELEGK